MRLFRKLPPEFLAAFRFQLLKILPRENRGFDGKACAGFVCHVFDHACNGRHKAVVAVYHGTQFGFRARLPILALIVHCHANAQTLHELQYADDRLVATKEMLPAVLMGVLSLARTAERPAYREGRPVKITIDTDLARVLAEAEMSALAAIARPDFHH